MPRTVALAGQHYKVAFYDWEWDYGAKAKAALLQGLDAQAHNIALPADGGAQVASACGYNALAGAAAHVDGFNITEQPTLPQHERVVTFLANLDGGPVGADRVADLRAGLVIGTYRELTTKEVELVCSARGWTFGSIARYPQIMRPTTGLLFENWPQRG
eukprot:TRINITY_DN4617_c0_g2_i2.p1 TRINITY_DN4617_c0_g2~~TRINITY_DN4617_c0_g2_i2.p1  ORF type:complete len:159 (-),score=15.06 TRINITY_DN4617_c0_g2_i2:378-854(-)